MARHKAPLDSPLEEAGPESRHTNRSPYKDNGVYVGSSVCTSETNLLFYSLLTSLIWCSVMAYATRPRKKRSKQANSKTPKISEQVPSHDLRSIQSNANSIPRN